MSTAALGAAFEVPTIDGGPWARANSAGSQSGRQMGVLRWQGDAPLRGCGTGGDRSIETGGRERREPDSRQKNCCRNSKKILCNNPEKQQLLSSGEHPSGGLDEG